MNLINFDMKTKIFTLIFLVSLTLIGIVKVNLSKSDSNMVLLLKNVEAFANDSEGVHVKVTTCIGKKPDCILPSGGKSTGHIVEIDADF